MNESVQLSFDYNEVKFVSKPADTYRARSVQGPSSKQVQLWLENKQSKHQWQATINSISECGPPGIPDAAVLAFLQKAFQVAAAECPPAEQDPALDLKCSNEDLLLILTLNLGGIWRPQYLFNLQQSKVDKVGILEAKLRDAAEEIAVLKKCIPACLILSTSIAGTVDGVVPWNVDIKHSIPVSHFQLSIDKKTITILQDGLYRLNISGFRATAKMLLESNPPQLRIMCNGVEILSTANDCAGFAQLDANDVLEARNDGLRGRYSRGSTGETDGLLVLQFVGNRVV